jgi:hypothetical protein
VKPESFERFPGRPSPAGGAFPGIRSATLVEAQICLGYAAVILVAAGSGGVAADLARWWIHVSSVLTDAVLVLLPMPNAWANHPHETAMYRHLLAASILLTLAAFLAFRHRWAQWGRRAELVVKHMPRERETPDELAQTGYYRMVFGTGAAIMLMLYADQLIESLTETLYTQSWTFLRAPLLAILAFALACNAVALRFACRRRATNA